MFRIVTKGEVKSLAWRTFRHLFFKFKRLAFMVMVPFYVLMAITSIKNPTFVLIFLITAYGILETVLLENQYRFDKKEIEKEKNLDVWGK